jgi:hypothetical protein
MASYDMERALLKRGYTVVRHSLAHLEIEFFNEEGEPDHYVDIFTGFFHKGLYCQPFALRGPEVVASDLVPVQSYEVDGVKFPGPRNPEAWLSYAYGSGWRVPDPTFKFITPRETRMRFEGWFGVFNRGRVYWDKAYLEHEESSGFADARGAIIAFLRDLPEGARILDLGCGDGRWSAEIARLGGSGIRAFLRSSGARGRPGSLASDDEMGPSRSSTRGARRGDRTRAAGERSSAGR